MQRIKHVPLALLSACLSVSFCAVVHAADITGFASGAVAGELELEQRFDADLSASELSGWMQQMASEPNHVSSAHDKANAEWQLSKFKEWGWDAAIESFSVLYPTPKEELVELVGPT